MAKVHLYDVKVRLCNRFRLLSACSGLSRLPPYFACFARLSGVSLHACFAIPYEFLTSLSEVGSDYRFVYCLSGAPHSSRNFSVHLNSYSHLDSHMTSPLRLPQATNS